jgi:sugar lactone lactonase YvrE
MKRILLVAGGLLLVATVATVVTAAETFTFLTLAGNSGFGSADGVSGNARFRNPTGVAVDAAGNVYVADSVNSTIRRISPAGVVGTLAGLAGTPGTNDGTGGTARFFGATGAAVNGAGDLVVADSQNHTIRRITAAGIVTTVAGLAGASGINDGSGAGARFNGPYGVTVDGSGLIYVADANNHAIRKIDALGAVTTFAGQLGVSGTNNGIGAAGQFQTPRGVAVDGLNNVYVADSFNHIIRKISPAGGVTTLAGMAGISGTNDGSGSAARFSFPSGVAVDAAGNVYVADFGNHIIRKITPGGVVSTVAGVAQVQGNVDATGSAARFFNPNGVVLDASTNLYVADNGNNTIRKVTPAAVVTTIAGRAGGSGTNDGVGSSARFSGPNKVAVDSSNYVYVADEQNNTIRKISPAGSVSTLAGLAGVAGTNNGTGNAARFDRPEGVAVDGSGNVFVADQNNHTIRKITPGAIVTTFAGLAGVAGTNDATGSSARFNQPADVAVDTSGNVFVADFGNNTIRKITTAGAVSTWAGAAGTVATNIDGTGAAARFNSPYGIAVDGFGNVYVADAGNSTVRKISPTRVVTTLAGRAAIPGSANGSGTNAQFYGASGVAVDVSGNLYVADSFNYTIRKITPGGVVSTIGGLAETNGYADGTDAVARFGALYGLAVDGSTNLYVADFDNNTIRKGIPTVTVPPVTPQSPSLISDWFSFGIQGLAGLRVDVEISTTLSNWQTVSSCILEGGTNIFSGPIEAPARQYFRARVP